MINNAKSCPFCGELPEIYQDEYAYKDASYWCVECMNDDCPITVETDDIETKEEAIEAWNTRK